MKLLILFLFIATISLGAQTLGITEEFLIPDSISPESYFEVSSSGEICILADNGVYNVNKKRWILSPKPLMPTLSFSLHPTKGSLEYLTIFDMQNSVYGLFKYVDLDSFYQLHLISRFDPSKKIVYPIQVGNELFLFWNNRSIGCGFGKLIYSDSILSILNLLESTAGPFTLINRNNLFFYYDNMLLNYHGNSGLRSIINTKITPLSICYDGGEGLYLSGETGIFQLDHDEKLTQVFSGEAGLIKIVGDKLYSYFPSERKIQVLTFR
jgi:hypothetical protein